MFTIIGIIMILGSIGLFFVGRLKKDFPLKLSKTIAIGIAVVGFFITGLFYANPGHSYKVFYPVNYPFIGKAGIFTSPGVHFSWWGNKREYQNEIAFKYVIPIDSLGTLPKLPKNIYAFSANDHMWEFADAVKANIGVSVIISINPKDRENFSQMVDETKYEDQLVYGRIIPDINTAIKNTCKLMYAQEYISGEAANFDRYLIDQLENGSYQLEPYYQESSDDVIGDTASLKKVASSGDNKKGTKRWKIKMDQKTGTPLRDGKKTSLALYHMTVRQAVSDNIDWEDGFDERLDKQKAKVAETQLEKQGAELAIFNQKKLYAEGEAAKTAEKARLEKEQIQQTITAQTAAQVAAFKVQEENNLLEASYKSSQRVKVQADAQAYANAKLVSAGLTPQEKAEYENKKAIGVAAEIAKIKFPEFMVNGAVNGNSSDGLLATLIGAELAKVLLAK